MQESGGVSERSGCPVINSDAHALLRQTSTTGHMPVNTPVTSTLKRTVGVAVSNLSALALIALATPALLRNVKLLGAPAAARGARLMMKLALRRPPRALALAPG